MLVCVVVMVIIYNHDNNIRLVAGPAVLLKLGT